MIFVKKIIGIKDFNVLNLKKEKIIKKLILDNK